MAIFFFMLKFAIFAFFAYFSIFGNFGNFGNFGYFGYFGNFGNFGNSHFWLFFFFFYAEIRHFCLFWLFWQFWQFWQFKHFGKRRACQRRPRNVLKMALRAIFKTFVSSGSGGRDWKSLKCVFFFFFMHTYSRGALVSNHSPPQKKI